MSEYLIFPNQEWILWSLKDYFSTSICGHSLSDKFPNRHSAEYRLRVWSVSKDPRFWDPDHICQLEYIHLFSKYFLKGSTGDGSPTRLLFRIAHGTYLTLLMTQLDWRWPALINSSCKGHFFFLNGMSHGMWDLSSLSRDWTCAPCSECSESLLEHQGSHQPQLISQRDMPCRWDCLCPPPCLIHYKVSQFQVNSDLIMTWTKK